MFNRVNLGHFGQKGDSTGIIIKNDEKFGQENDKMTQNLAKTTPKMATNWLGQIAAFHYKIKNLRAENLTNSFIL